MKFRTLLLGLSALFIAVSAAYFSVTGLSKLFAGATTEVILMASSLEFGKLISASFLYAYWDRVNKLIRTYLVIGVVVLILITSAGIYGFLTAAYQVTADQLSIMDKQTEMVELKKQRFTEQLESFNIEREGLSETVSELSRGLANNVIQYKDSEGNIITTTSSANRTAFEKQLENARERRDILSSRIDVMNDSITSLDIQVLEIQQGNDIAAEVGPLKYMAEITGQPMNKIVNWFALFIVFVFDPLAVTLVIAFNTAIKLDKDEKTLRNIRKKQEYGLYGDTITPDEDEEDEHPDPTESLINAHEKYKVFKSENVLPSISHGAGITFGTSDVSKETSQDKPDVDDTEDKKKVNATMNDELLNLKREIRRLPIDTDGDGIVDGYDTDGDGLIDNFSPKSSTRWRYAEHRKPYYARPGFDWNDRNKWINDQNAINYWVTHVKTSKYPDNFDSKTY